MRSTSSTQSFGSILKSYRNLLQKLGHYALKVCSGSNRAKHHLKDALEKQSVMVWGTWKGKAKATKPDNGITEHEKNKPVLMPSGKRAETNLSYSFWAGSAGKGMAVGQTDGDVSSEKTSTRELYLRGVHMKEVMCSARFSQSWFQLCSQEQQLPTKALTWGTEMIWVLHFLFTWLTHLIHLSAYYCTKEGRTWTSNF